jgi:predicted short-subunit dehydrogenase-like oxidoreductase (DUF2520 family)
MRLGIAGGGRAAWAFGSAWRRTEQPLAGVWLREESRSAIAALLGAPRRALDELARDCDLLLLAVSDRAIGEVAALVPETRAILFHASGSLTSVRGGFSLHPLRALPPVGEASDLRDALLVFEGSHRDVAEQIASSIGARFAQIAPEQKPLYHAAAVFGSNYVAAVLDIAEQLIGIENARGDLVALAESAIRNWSAHAGPQRFTGPAARGDRETLARHIAALQSHPQLAHVYELLAAYIAGTRLAQPE